MRTFGLIGYPLSHSFSQKYFTEKFEKEKISDCEFKNYPIQNINDFPALAKNEPTLCGLSVTIPHKQSVIKFLDEVDGAAKEIGAVNCIKIDKSHPDSDRGTSHKLTGYNTDIFGFENSIKPLLKPNHTKALILGAGGAAKAIEYVFKKLKIDYLVISRNKETGTKKYSDLNKEIIAAYPVLVNTTPLGMYPNISQYPEVPYEYITAKHLLYDLTYNPEETLFLRKGKAKGAQAKNGLEMLHLQAEEAWRIWNSPSL